MDFAGGSGADGSLSKTRDAMAALGAASGSPSAAGSNGGADNMFNLKFHAANAPAPPQKPKPIVVPNQFKANKAKRATGAATPSDSKLTFKEMEQRFVERVEQLLLKVGRPCELAGLGQRIPMPSALMGKTTLKYILRKYPDRFELIWREGHVRAVTAASLGSGGAPNAGATTTAAKTSVKPSAGASAGGGGNTPRAKPGAVAFASSNKVGGGAPKSELEQLEARYVREVERMLQTRKGEPCGLPTVGKLCSWPSQLGKPRVKWTLQQYPSRFRLTDDGLAVELVRTGTNKRSVTPTGANGTKPATGAGAANGKGPSRPAEISTSNNSSVKAFAAGPRATATGKSATPSSTNSKPASSGGDRSATPPAAAATPDVVDAMPDNADLGASCSVELLLVNTTASLEKVLQECAVLRASPQNQVDQVVAMDVKGVRTTSLDLICVATSSMVYVFDCVALTPQVVCDALRPLLESEDVVKFIHDLHLHSYMLANFGNVLLAGVLDTQIAGEMTWGDMQISLNGVLRALGLPCQPLKSQVEWRLERDHTLWSKRPFLRSDLKSAALDARLLLDAASTLMPRLDGYSWNRILKASGLRAVQSARSVDGQRMVCFDRSNRFALASVELMQVLEDGAAVYPLPEPSALDGMDTVASVLPPDIAEVFLQILDLANKGSMDASNCVQGDSLEQIGGVHDSSVDDNSSITDADDMGEDAEVVTGATAAAAANTGGAPDVNSTMGADGDVAAAAAAVDADTMSPPRLTKLGSRPTTAEPSPTTVSCEVNNDDAEEALHPMSPRLGATNDSISQTAPDASVLGSKASTSNTSVGNTSPHMMNESADEHVNEIKLVTEIVLDLGRRPMCWVGRVQRKRAWLMADASRVVTRQDLDGIAAHFEKEEDGSSSSNSSSSGLTHEPRIIPGTLHRCSPVLDRDGALVGVTISIGRWVRQCADIVLDLLLGSTRDVLFLGSGIGRTAEAQVTVLREVARVLSEHEHVCIIDTSHRMSGDAAHHDLGLARCFSVPRARAGESGDTTADTMLRCVREHAPGVLVVDDVSTSAQVEVLRQIRRRGVRILVGVSGELTHLLESDELQGLLGGTVPVDRLDVGKESTARAALLDDARACGPPLRRRARESLVNTIVSVPHDLVEWEVIMDVGTAVDSLLRVNQCEVQERSRVPGASYVHMRQTWRSDAEMAN